MDCQADGRISVVEMPKDASEFMREILAQNRMILEANCIAMRLLSQPMMVLKQGKPE